MAQDYYQTLGVERGASADDIKRAYRKMAHQYHPDKVGGDEEKFKQVNEAYQVLSDTAKRRQYDQFGQTFEGGGGGPGFGFNINVDDVSGIGDIFEQFFGGGGQRRPGSRVRRGGDVGMDVTIDFVESARGVTREITSRLYQTCTRCRGNGAEPGTRIVTCATCNGRGSVATSSRTMFGMFAREEICRTCEGVGTTPEKACRQCRGQGREMATRTLDVDIPAGIADGQTIRLTGRGEVPPHGGIAGDLYVTVHVTPHGQLSREGDSVRATVEVAFADAALGTRVTVPTIAGEQPLDIPAGTQPGTELKLPRQGFPSLSGGRAGDEIVTVKIVVPTKLTRQQRSLLEDFRGGKKKRLLF